MHTHSHVQSGNGLIEMSKYVRYTFHLHQSTDQSTESGGGGNGSYLQSTNEKIAAKTFEVKTKDEFDIWYKIEYLSQRREKGSIFLYTGSWAPIPLVNDV